MPRKNIRKIKKMSAPDLVCEEMKSMIVQNIWSEGDKIPSQVALRYNDRRCTAWYQAAWYQSYKANNGYGYPMISRKIKRNLLKSGTFKYRSQCKCNKKHKYPYLYGMDDCRL